MRRRVLLAVNLPLLVALAGYGVFSCAMTLRHGINPATYARIRFGMTSQELEKLLGVPPGDYGQSLYHGHSVQKEERGEPVSPLDPGTYSEWFGDEVGIITIADQQGRVAVKYLVQVDRASRPSSVWEGILRWLGL